MRREQLFAKALVLVSLVFFCSSCHGYNSSQPLLPLTNLSVQLAQPTRVTQFVLTPITVALNGSICKHMGQAAVGSEVQLVLQAAAADGRDLAVRSGSISSNCSSLVFPVFLNASARAGSFQARIVLIKQQRSLQLPGNIAVVVPPVLSVKSRTLNVSADQSAFAVGVQLSEPAAAQGVSVRMQLTDEDAARVYKGSLAWPAGSSGLQSFWLSLQSVPSSGRLLVQLVQPQGAVLDPAAAEAEVLVQSPVVSFKSGLGYYRGINTSTPQLHFTVSGVSAFPSEFTFSTFLLPGSRPSAVPCHPLASACSVADLEAVDNVTLTGTRWLSPGQQQLQPVDLPINWGRLPPEAELRVGVRIVSRTNVRVAQQQGQVAAIVFGTPPGHCPPGSALLSDTGSHNSSRDGPTYTNVAALQDLGLALFPETESSSNSSRKNGSGTSNSSSAPAMPNDGSSSTRSLLEGSGCSSNSSTNCSQPGHAGNAAGAAAAAITMDLDPPFRPMVDRYIALLPPKPSGTGKLLLASSRWGDVVVVDATACDGLDSSRYQVVWGKQQRMWRQRYSLAGQNSSCWLRVHVFTKTDAPGSYAHSSGGSSSIYDSSPDEDDSTNSSSNGGGGGDGNGDGSTYSSNKTSSSMWALPQDFVLYRSYTIRFIPLRPPEQLSLRSISFSNSGTTVIACGVPRVLSHLFQAAPPTLLSSVMSMAGAAGIGSSSGNESSSVAAAAFTGAAAAVAMGGFVPVSSAAGSRSSAAAGHVAAAEAGRYLPRPLVAAPGQVVKVAYLVMMKPGTGTGSSGSSGSSSSSSSSSSATTEEQQQQQQQEREQDQAAAAAPEAFASAAGSRSRQEQYSLFDPATNKTVVWSRYTSVDCAQDRYILLPLAQLHSDMKMVPELLDADAAGVNITMSEAALALSGPGNGSSSGSNSSGSSSGSLYNADSSVRNPTGGLSGNKAGAGGHAAAVAGISLARLAAC